MSSFTLLSRQQISKRQAVLFQYLLPVGIPLGEVATTPLMSVCVIISPDGAFNCMTVAAITSVIHR
jgi:hypothetical protein